MSKIKKVLLFLTCFILLLNAVVMAGVLPEKVIDFTFNEIDIKEVFRSISKATNVNILVNSDLKKKITVELNNTTLETAVNLITKSYGLDYIFKDNVLVIDTKERIKEIFNKGKIKYSNYVSDTEDNKVDVPVNNYEDQDFVNITEPIVFFRENSNQKPSLLINDIEEEVIEDPYRIVQGIGKGIMIPVVLDVGMVSTTAKSPVRARVLQNIAYKGKIVIPKGSIFAGYGVPDYNVRLIFAQITTLNIADREIDVSAHLIKDDGTPGFCSEYVDLKMKYFWPNFAMNLVTDISSVFKDSKTVTDSSGNVQEVEKNTVKNEMIDNSQDSMNEWTNQVMNDAKEYKAIMTVNAGIKCFVFIDKKIPLEYFTAGMKGADK